MYENMIGGRVPRLSLTLPEAGQDPVLYSILIHTVTHADLHAAIRLPDHSEAIARPHYSSFNTITQMLLREVELAPVFPILLSTPDSQEYPIGLEFKLPVHIGEISEWRLRSKEDKRWPNDTAIMVTRIYFPVVSIIVPTWLDLSSLADKSIGMRRRKFLYLISGSGIPRNVEHNPTGNSTKRLAKLIQKFCQACAYPTRALEVLCVDSGPGLFDFSANCRFVQSTLTPLISEKRSELAAEIGEEWLARFSLMITLGSHTAARTSAIMSIMRQFRPDFLHVSETKTLWYGWPSIDQLWLNDVEFLGYEAVEMSPVVACNSLSPLDQMLVQKMKDHRDMFAHSTKSDNELRKFWLRKSFKPVLAVLMVVKNSKDSDPSFYTGMNIEVSMPTGSLCAERSAIGNALARDPTIQRHHLRAIAVLSLALDDDLSSEINKHGVNSSPILADAWDDRRFTQRPTRAAAQSTRHDLPRGTIAQNPINPCGACKEWLKKIAFVNPDFHVLTFRSTACDETFVKPVLR